MLRAIYFSLHFAMIFLGVVLAIHFDFWIGVAIAITFTLKWWFMFPQHEGRSTRLDESFERNKQMEFKFDK